MKQTISPIRNTHLKAIAFVIALIQLSIPLFNFPISSKENTVLSTERRLEKESQEEQKNYRLTAEFEKECYCDDEEIVVSYVKNNISSFRFVTDGVTVVESDTDKKIRLLVNVEDEVGVLNVYAENSSGESLQSALYFYNRDGYVCLSDRSIDYAFDTFVDLRIKNGEILEDERESEWYVFSRRFIIENNSYTEDATNRSIPLLEGTRSLEPTDTVVSGTLQWETNTNDYLPLKKAKIELRDKEGSGSRIIATSQTDNEGHFMFIFDNDTWDAFESGGLDVFVRYYANSSSFDFLSENSANVVSNLLSYMGISSTLIQNFASTVAGILLAYLTDNGVLSQTYFDTTSYNNVQAGSTVVYNNLVTYNEAATRNKYFYIQQALVVGQEFAATMGMSFNKHICVVFTDSDTLHNNAFCFGQNDLQLQYSIMYIGKDYFTTFDVIMHEYGHYVEHSVGTYGSSVVDILDTTNSNHHSGDDNIYAKGDKSFALTLTWSESWATAFMFLAQKYYDTEYTVISGFADTKDRVDPDYATLGFDENSCEAQEDAVIAFLWDFYTHISSGYQSWWNYTTANCSGSSHKIYTLNDFVHTIDVQHPNLRSTVGQYLSAHQLAPGNPTITNASSVSATTPPILTWRVNGSQYNPFDRFKVVFYSKYNDYVYSTNLINSNSASYNSTIQYTVSALDWGELINHYGGEFVVNISIQGFHSQTPSTGPYYTKYLQLTITSHKTLSLDQTTKYSEMILTLDKGKYCDISVTFATAGTKLFQTLGTQDTVIKLYSASGTLLATDNDDGYVYNGFIRYECAANTLYKIRVSFYNSTVYGKLKFAIIPTQWLKKTGCTAINSFADIREYTTAPMTISTSAEPYNSKVFVYTPAATRDYSFEITSDFDTFIYVIDPRSTNPIVWNEDFNDDGGEGSNAFLTVSLTADMPYLVIYSAFNPGALTETQSMYVRIKKA